MENGFFVKKNVEILKMDLFSTALNLLKILISLPSGGRHPPDSLRGGGGVIAFKWSMRPPEKYPGGATGIYSLQYLPLAKLDGLLKIEIWTSILGLLFQISIKSCYFYTNVNPKF